MRFAPLALAAICGLVLFTGLGRVPAIDWREARDAEVARELIANHEALTPILGREALFEKPLLAYTPGLVARKLRSGSVTGARQLRAALAVALVLLISSVAARNFGTRPAWLTAGVLATSLGLPLAARVDGAQLLGTLFGWVGCAGLADVTFGRREGRTLRLVVTYGALGAALLTAGPLPALWPFGGLAIYLLLARRREGWRQAQPLAGLALMVGIALPWYGALTERYGATFLAHAAVFPYGVEPRGSWLAGPVLALSGLAIGFFPWSALLPAAILHAGTRWRAPRPPLLALVTPEGTAPARAASVAAADPMMRERREENLAHFYVASLLAALAPVLVYPTPPLTALLPALPAAALLAGRFLDHLFESPRRVAPGLSRSVLMLAIAGSAGAVLFAAAAGPVREAAPELRLVATVIFVTAWLPFLASLAGRPRLAALLLTLPVTLGAPAVSLRLLPAAQDYLGTRTVAQAIAAAVPPRAPLGVVEPPPPSLRLYAQRDFVLTSASPDSLRALRGADGHAYLAYRPGREHDVAQAAHAPLEILMRTPTLVLARVAVP